MTTSDDAKELVRIAARDLLDELNRLEPLAVASPDGESLYPQLARALDTCLAQLRVTNLVGRNNEVPSSILWNAAGHLLERGWLQARARGKPRGYPGDYEMLARFYQRTLCDDPLGRLFDRYFQEQPAPRAVKNRMRMMADWIVAAVQGRPAASLKVAIVGSAFGLELRDALLRLDSSDRQRLTITLLDLDPLALDNARQVLEPLLPAANLALANFNPLKLLRGTKFVVPLAGSDLIFCPGVFDYLTDDEAAQMLGTLYAQLLPGGRLTVFQFAPHDPTRAYMEWIGNWYLTYRDAEHFRGCVERAKLPAAGIGFGYEPLGVDLFVTVTAPDSLRKG